MLFIYLIIFIIVLFSIRKIKTIDVPELRQLCPKPPMGWNSWTCFGTEINESLIRDTAAAMVSKGLLAAGYEYVIVDDGWMDTTRDRNGKLKPCPIKFPSGMKALGEYIHSLGLKFGIYTSVGRYTCEGYPGSYGHEEVDAATFHDWGVDYVKIDWCTYKWIWWPYWNYRYRYELMSRAFNKYPIVIAMCNWGFGNSAKWGKKLAHTVRITFDVSADEDSINYIIKRGKALKKYNQVNGWNDLDSLEVGNGICHSLAVKQFYWWCTLRSPLIIGADILSICDDDLEILLNTHMIRINQGI
jgi:alpha-galactosidase